MRNVLAKRNLFQNQLTFAKVMMKYQVSCFFWHLVCIHHLCRYMYSWMM